MIKAVFIDFYGTVVHEGGVVIEKVTQEIFDTGIAEDKFQIGTFLLYCCKYYLGRACSLCCTDAYKID